MITDYGSENKKHFEIGCTGETIQVQRTNQDYKHT